MKAVSKVVLGHYDEKKLGELTKTLEKIGVKVFPARDGESVLREVAERRPDLVLADVLLPGVNGFEVCRTVKESMGKRYVAVVLLTDREDAYSRGRARYVGADHILEYPVTEGDLKKVLATPFQEMDDTEKLLLGKKEKHDKLMSAVVKGRPLIKPDGLMAKISDPLTGLCNRAYIHLKLEEEFKKSKRYGTPLSCMLMEIENFDSIVERHGKAGANEVLVEVASMMLCESRDIDIVGRVENAKFMILLPNTALDGARIMADRVFNNVLERPIELSDGGKKVTLRISAGIAHHPNEKVDNVEDLLDQAVKALDTAKSQGGNRICALS